MVESPVFPVTLTGWFLPETWTILIACLIGGVVAVVITERFKQWLRNLRTVREIRRNICAEMAHNLASLHVLFSLAEGAQESPGRTIDLNACAKDMSQRAKETDGQGQQ